jgi:formylmethanofuran dehydrogenase subunit D
LHAADYEPPHEVPDADFPLWLTTGRVAYHFHTRTKTGRVDALRDAAGDVFVQLSSVDSVKLGIANDDLVIVESRRGSVTARARVGDIEAGHAFMPFHYGSWDQNAGDPPRAANELTLTEWDPVSKQPHFKYAAVRIAKRAAVPHAASVVESGSKALQDKDADSRLAEADGRTAVGTYLGLLADSEGEIADAFETIAEHHSDEPDIQQMCTLLAAWSRQHGSAIRSIMNRFGEEARNEDRRVRRTIFQGPRRRGLALVRDLHDLYLLVVDAQLCWTVLLQSAHALHDKDLEVAAQQLGGETDGQLAWLKTRIKQAAPQALTVSK